MASNVTLPRLGQGMESGTIVRWLKAEGEGVERGDPLYELDTEKVTQEVEAEASGVLLRILAREGEEIEVGKTIAVIGEQGERVEEPKKADKPKQPEKPAQEADKSEAPAEAPLPAAPKAEPSERVKASPLARRVARERGVELSQIQGTGPEGRIVAEDVERAEAAPSRAVGPRVPEAPEVVSLTGVRRTIARRLSESWQVPQFQISMSADMQASIQLREALVARTEEDEVRPSFSDILTKVCAVALLRHRDLNAHFVDEAIHLFPTANVGIAVAAPQGLLVPVIRSAERKSVGELAAERADLVERTRAGKLQPGDLDGGTFTISNLGMFGVERFSAILNPPQAAILAVGAIQERPVVQGGQVVVRPLIELTLTCDHRSVDGAIASLFLQTVKAFLEQPGLAL